jgi:hypothetical protein
LRAHYSKRQRLALPKPENEDGIKTIIFARPWEMLTHPAWPLRKHVNYKGGNTGTVAAATCSDGDHLTC